MSMYRRPRVPGATVFYSVHLEDPTSTALVDDIERLRGAVYSTLQERPVDVLAWTVLPNKMHTIWRLPEGDHDHATRWRLIKTRFSRGLPPAMPRSRSQLMRAERGIWQRRFWEHHIRGAEDLRRHLRFCWESPMAEGLVSNPQDWPYSSRMRAEIGEKRDIA